MKKRVIEYMHVKVERVILTGFCLWNVSANDAFPD